uniref:Uncharacterized protein n=1 Tax=Sinocyclocheilus grahami TaxID=75366 RepID=A0A672LV93_SINGR
PKRKEQLKSHHMTPLRSLQIDHLELQQCTERLHSIIEEFEEGYRRSPEASRDAGWLGICGGVALFAGIVAAPFTLGTSLLATAYVVVTRVLALRAARFSLYSCVLLFSLSSYHVVCEAGKVRAGKLVTRHTLCNT